MILPRPVKPRRNPVPALFQFVALPRQSRCFPLLLFDRGSELGGKIVPLADRRFASGAERCQRLPCRRPPLD